MSATLKVAYQGEPGAYSEAATFEAFKATGLTPDAVGYSSFDDVFGAPLPDLLFSSLSDRM